ncbi:MAG: hypothetical protein WHS86_16165 [Desulfosoma sp.]
MTNELKQTLCEVRKAYRLIYLYQRSVLSTIERFAKEFGDSVFYWWTPTHYSPPPMRSTNIHQRLCWDLIPFYLTAVFYRYSKGDIEKHPAGDWLLELNVVTDSAALEKFEARNLQPDPCDFSPPEDSKTKIIVAMWFCEKEATFNWYYQKPNLKYSDDEIMRYEIPAGLICVKKEYQLEELGSEPQIVAAASDFKTFLNRNIPHRKW